MHIPDFFNLSVVIFTVGNLAAMGLGRWISHIGVRIQAVFLGRFNLAVNDDSGLCSVLR